MPDTEPTVLVTMPTGLQEDFFDDELRNRLEALGDVTWNRTANHMDPEEVMEQLPGVDVVVAGWGTVEFTESVLTNADELELIAYTGGSVAPFATDALYDHGVAVTSANHQIAEFVAEFTLGHVIAAQRDLVGSHERLRQGEYGHDQPYETLYGSTISLVGLGTVGRYLLPLLEPFDVDVRLYDPYVPPVDVAEYDFLEKASLTEALESADIVSIHASRTPETIGMIGANELGSLPDDALLVNTARPEIVDREALENELRSGRLRAALDVFHEEPLPSDSPLRDLENVQLTPHLAGYGPLRQLASTVVNEIERYYAGETLQHEIPQEQAIRMTR